MRKLTIEWKYYAKNGKTCDRCSGTGINLHSVINALKLDLAYTKIKFNLKETVLGENQIPHSNSVIIDGIPIEKILPEGTAGESECCSCGKLCGKTTVCRTIKVRGITYEEIPKEIIMEAVTSRIAEKNYLNVYKGDSMKIQVFGSGCEKCRKLFGLVQKTVAELKVKASVEYITDIAKMAENGFITSPVLVVDGTAVVSGFVPDENQLKQLIGKVDKSQKGGCCNGGCCCGGSKC